MIILLLRRETIMIDVYAFFHIFQRNNVVVLLYFVFSCVVHTTNIQL